MRNKPFWEKIKYKYDYIGQVEKDGEVYKKYRKVRRFPITKKALGIVIFILIAVSLLALLNLIAGLFFAGTKAPIYF
ncbi:MAG TPA: hypothetical protein VMD04_05595 [Candidatus Margulisiibacteriota bacterium]|nr:hypothetical protein [Candidatus Margulisiibacteriota bacterium]